MEAQKSLTEDWSFWLLSVLALTLIGVFYFYNPLKKSNSAPAWVLADLKIDRINKLRYWKNGRLQVEVNQQNGSWKITRPSGIRANSNTIKNWAETIISPDLKDKFKLLPDQDYGFDSPPQYIEVVANNKKHRLYLGNDRPLGNGFYLRYGSGKSGEGYVVAGKEKNKLSRSLFDLRRKALFSATPDEVDRFALYHITGGNRKSGVIYDHGSANWKLSKPRKQEFTDTTANKIKTFLRSLLYTNAGEFYDDKTLTFVEPVRAEIALTLHGRKKTLKVGKKIDENRLVKLTGWPVVGIPTDPLKKSQNLPVLPDNWSVSPK